MSRIPLWPQSHVAACNPQGTQKPPWLCGKAEATQGDPTHCLEHFPSPGLAQTCR